MDLGEKKIKYTLFAILSITVLYIIVFCSVYFIDLGSAISSSDSAKHAKAGNYAMENEILKESQVVFFGDSITEMYDTNRYFKDNNFLNRGISGDTTNGALARLESNVLNLKPKIIIMLFGVNDLNNGLSIKEITKNYETMLATIQLQLPNCKVLVQSVYPVNNFKSLFSFTIVNKRVNSDIDLLNISLSSLVDKFGYDFVNINSTLKNNQGYLKDEFTIDGLHINAKAYKTVTEKLTPYINKSLQTIVK